MVASARNTRGWPAIALFDLTPPALLTAVAVHELLYDHTGAPIWLLVLGIIWPLALRRRFPVAVFAVCLALGLALWAEKIFTVAELSLLVALYTVAAHRSLRLSLPAFVAVELGVVLLSTRFAPTGSVNDAILLLGGLAAAALLAGTTMRAQRRYLASVEDRAARLERERYQQAQLAAAAERTRIAREMHDIVAHGLSVVIALAEGAAMTSPSDPEAARHAMHQVAATGRRSMTEMRRLLGVLRDDQPVEHEPQPNLAMLQTLVDEVSRTGMTVSLRVTGDPDDAGDALQTTVFRIVQEALTNVLKHSDGATNVCVSVDVGTDLVTLVVNDNGDPRRTSGLAPEGNGLSGMRERVTVFGGTLHAAPTARGWQVTGELPIG